MVSAENKHWNEVEHSVFSLSWATHLIVRPLDGQPLSEEQESGYAEQLTETALTGVHFLKVRGDEELPYIGFSLVIEAEDESEAWRATNVTALGALAATGYDVGMLEFVAGHVVYEEEFRDACRAALTARTEPPTAADRRFELPDQEAARDTFLEIRDTIAESSALIDRFLTDAA